MREIEIEGQKIKVRGLRRKEIREQLAPYGYTSMFFRPVLDSEGNPDFIKVDEGRNKALEIVMSPDEIERIEDLGGNAACQKVINAIHDETYPNKAEEKNLLSSGSGAAPLNESAPAPTAAPSASESV